MDADRNRNNRRSIRLRDYDYSQAGAYFLTVCVQNRECLFGEINDGKMRLSDAGHMVQTVWSTIPSRFSGFELDEFVVMPNHIHGILCRGEPCVRPNYPGESTKGEHKVRPYGTLPDSLGRVIQAFKSISTYEYSLGVKNSGWQKFVERLWQRNYWDHVIRNESELNEIREYIRNNPAKWELDKLYIEKTPIL